MAGTGTAFVTQAAQAGLERIVASRILDTKTAIVAKVLLLFGCRAVGAQGQGLLNASACGGGSPPSWCLGSDIGTWVNAAYAYCGKRSVLIFQRNLYTSRGY